MRKVYVVICLLLFSGAISAQRSSPPAIDSIRSVLSAAKDDSNKVRSLLDAAMIYSDSSPTQSAAWVDEALQLSKKIKWNVGIIESYRVMSFPYWNNENWVKVIELLQVAIDLINDQTPAPLAFDLYTQAGVSYISLEIYPMAMEYFKKALAIGEAMGNEAQTGIAMGNIGWVYYNMGNYKEAMNYGRRNLEASLKYNNKEDIANCYGVGGLIYHKLNYPDSAIYFFNKALSMSEYLYVPFHSATLNGLAEVYMESNNYPLALKYLLEGEAVAAKNKNYRNLQDIYLNLSKTYEALDNKSAAFEAYKNYNVFKDSSNTAVKQHEVAYLMLQSEANKRDLMQKAALERQTLVRNASIVGLLLAAILVFVLVIRFREKKKSHAQLQDAFEKLKTTQEQLIEKEKLASLGQLTAGVAHEINNPINFVSGNVSPLKRNFSEVRQLIESYEKLLSQTDKKLLAEKIREEFGLELNLAESDKLLNGIAEGSRRTADIVKGLRNFSRVDDEEMKMANINEGIDSTLILLQNKIKHQKIEVIKSFASMPEIRCYPGQLNQVFMNVISNAIDAIGEFHPGERKIFITTSYFTMAELVSVHPELKEKILDDQVKAQRFAAITIRDTGAGISEEVKKKMFDPFYTTKDVGKGTGLGLSISYGIVEKHRGIIHVTSALEKGTEFLIVIPATTGNS